MSLFADAFSIDELREMLTAWKDCYKALATGQATYYRIGTREFQAIDLDKIMAQIKELQDAIDEKSGSQKPRVRRVVYRDL